LVAAVLSSCSGSAARAESRSPAITGSDILALQMFNPDDGVAVAVPDAATGHRDYLAATDDGGTTWRVAGDLPGDVDPTHAFDLRMAFAGPGVGYVQTIDPVAATVSTVDGGRTWVALDTPGQSTALSLDGPDLWIVANVCPTTTTAPELCPSRLLTYRRGRPTPLDERPIPTMGIVASPGIAGTVRAAVLLDRLGTGSAVVEEGGEGSPSSLLVTGDSGRHWTELDDPCEGLDPSGLVAITPTAWDLYCQLDGGMNQGEAAVYASSDQGRTWTLRAAANEQGNTLGRLGDGISGDLTRSGDGRVLWLLGSVGGVMDSTDGGRDWTDVTLQTGGDDTELATAGSTDAWLPLPGTGLYRTSDATRWTKLP
jgi:photosystem II stability/assembly factor-like uncharacterized protein